MHRWTITGGEHPAFSALQYAVYLLMTLTTYVVVPIFDFCHLEILQQNITLAQL